MRPEGSAQQFESIVAELLVKLGFEKVERNIAHPARRAEVDITFRKKSELAVVEVKNTDMHRHHRLTFSCALCIRSHS